LQEAPVDKRTGGDACPTVEIIMGSDSDLKTMRPAAQVLADFGISYDMRVVSAHRTPDDLFDYAKGVEKRGLSLIIAGAGGAAHLPGMTASKTILPVVGVPVVATPLRGVDALLSIMQMPAEVGVATVGVGPAGAKNAAVFAAKALAARDPSLRHKLHSLHGSAHGGASAAEVPASVVILAKDQADLHALRFTAEYLTRLDIKYDAILGPDCSSRALARQLSHLEIAGAKVCIVGSRGGIGFARAVAKATILPVLNVPIVGEPVARVEEFLEPFLDMPPGLATFAIDKPGAINAALFAATVISAPSSRTWKRLQQMRAEQVERVRDMKISG
jgi:5-(carboxyamino)imidazole ribonucleotide mutase